MEAGSPIDYVKGRTIRSRLASMNDSEDTTGLREHRFPCGAVLDTESSMPRPENKI